MLNSFTSLRTVNVLSNITGRDSDETPPPPPPNVVENEDEDEPADAEVINVISPSTYDAEQPPIRNKSSTVEGTRADGKS